MVTCGTALVAIRPDHLVLASTSGVDDGRELIAKVPIRFDMNFKRADTIPVAGQAEDCRAFAQTP